MDLALDAAGCFAGDGQERTGGDCAACRAEPSSCCAPLLPSLTPDSLSMLEENNFCCGLPLSLSSLGGLLCSIADV